MNLLKCCSDCLLYLVLVFLPFRKADSSPLASQHAANNNSNVSMEGRHKRSDCSSMGQTGETHIDCACYHPKCSEKSFRDAISSICYNSQTCDMFLSCNKESAYWSSSHHDDTFLSANCIKLSGCGDGMSDYNCTCPGGFVELDCGFTPLKVILPATIVPVVAIVLLVLAAYLAYRWYKRRNQQISPTENHHAVENADSMPSNTMYKNRVLLQ